MRYHLQRNHPIFHCWNNDNHAVVCSFVCSLVKVHIGASELNMNVGEHSKRKKDNTLSSGKMLWDSFEKFWGIKTMQKRSTNTVMGYHLPYQTMKSNAMRNNEMWDVNAVCLTIYFAVKKKKMKTKIIELLNESSTKMLITIWRSYAARSTIWLFVVCSMQVWFLF